MKLVCEGCGRPVPAADMDLTTALAKCRGCDSVFGIEVPRGIAPGRGREGDSERSHEEEEDVETEPGPTPKPAVAVPAGYKLETLPRGIRVGWAWFNLGAVLLVPFTLFWNGFMVVWHVISLSTGMWFMSLFGLIHTAVGLGMAYLCLAMLFNRTAVEVDRGVLRIAYGPIPWWGGRELEAARIRQLYVKKVLQHSKHGSVQRYEVHAVLVDETHQPLVDGLESPQQARFLEQELERALAIEDQPVEGEHAG